MVGNMLRPVDSMIVGPLLHFSGCEVSSLVKQYCVDYHVGGSGILLSSQMVFWQKHYVQERQIHNQNKYLLQ